MVLGGDLLWVCEAKRWVRVSSVEAAAGGFAEDSAVGSLEERTTQVPTQPRAFPYSLKAPSSLYLAVGAFLQQHWCC